MGEGGSGVIEMGDTITVKELSEKLAKPIIDVIRTLMFTGVMAGVNQEIDFATVEKVCEKYECLLARKQEREELDEVIEEEEDSSYRKS